MPGTFSKASRPDRPGAYFNWVAITPATVQPAIGTVVAIPFTSDWGPFKTPTLVQSFDEYLAVFGPTVGTPGYNAVWQAFQGEGGYEGRWGAGGVLCYRMGSSAANKASRQLQNTAPTPATAVTLTARYEGTYGSNIRVTTQDHAADPSMNELLVYVSGDLAESYIYPDVDIAGLVAEIALVSQWVTAALVTDGVSLAPVTKLALTGGNDGTVVTGADYTATMNALESQRFDVFSPYALTDSTILAAIQAWAAGPPGTGLNSKGKRFEVVTGGASDEDAATAVARSLVFNDGNFVNLGMGHFLDNNLLDAAGAPTLLSTAQFAPRFAGVLTQRGEALSTTFARFPGVTLVNGPIEDDISAAFRGGVIVFSEDDDPDAPVHAEKGITTFTKGGPNGSTADLSFPYLIFRNPKFLRTMQNIEKEWVTWANQRIIGKLPVNDKTRDHAISFLGAQLARRERIGIVQSGWTVVVDTDPPPTDQDEFIALRVGIGFGRSAEQVYFTVSVR